MKSRTRMAQYWLQMAPLGAALVLLACSAYALVDTPRIAGSGAYSTRLNSSAPVPNATSASAVSSSFGAGSATSAAVADVVGGTDHSLPGAAKEPTSVSFSLVDAFFEVLGLPLVRTRAGWVRGSLLQSRKGRLIYAFRGMRYAQPPVGPLRFQPPQPYPEWKGVFDASKDGAACPQENGYDFPTSEDCLFINVYSTLLPWGRFRPLRPVFLYIHMGGWYGNNARSDNIGPQYLADQDIVIVTFNYRLGALGFISTGDEVLIGNYAMKDQVAAMRWVQSHIADFGGDPHRVTLVGYSAGGASVWFHMASPMSRGLFHRAVAMSSSINAQADNTQDMRGALDLARRQAKMAGCEQVDTSQQIKDCLMQLPAQNISGVLAAGDLFDFGIDPVLIWFPVIEKDTPGQEHFLTKNVLEYFVTGDFAQVPFITGHTRNEFDWRASTVYNDPELLNEMNSNWSSVAPRAFMYVDSPRGNTISQQLRAFYLGGGNVTASNLQSLGQLYSDSIICFGVDRAAKSAAKFSSAPVWFYTFEYQGRYSYNYRGNTTVPYGVMHQDDVMYMFYLASLFPYFGPDAPENWAVDRLTRLLGNFVIHGHPTPRKGVDPLLKVHWQPFTISAKRYLRFGNTSLTMQQNNIQNRMQLWNKLFPISSVYLMDDSLV